MRRRRPDGPLVPLGGGRYRLGLGEDERSALTRFLTELESLLGDPGDARLRRLFPTAYHDDPARDAEYQRLMRDELLQSRAASFAAARELLASDPDTEFDEGRVHEMVKVLNGLRLVLGTLLDVGEDDDDPGDDDPNAHQLQLYGYLGWLLDWFVSVLADELN